MEALKSAQLYFKVLSDVINSKDYFRLDDASVGEMTKVLLNQEIVNRKIAQKDMTKDSIYKAAVRIHNLLSGIEDNDDKIKIIIRDINSKFDLTIDSKVLYYNSKFGTLPEKRPCRYEAHYRVSEDGGRTEYVNIITYSAQEATEIFTDYMKKVGYYDNIFYHSTEAKYEGPLYRYEEVGSVIGANWF